MTTTSTQFSAKILDKKNLTKNTTQFIFEKSSLPDFLPGQYVDIFLDIDGKKDYHSFTISSSPTKKTFSITTKKGISEYKKQLIGKKIGESLDFYGPLGGFVLSEESKYPLVLLSGGLGITPFYSMIAYVHEKKLAIPITLIASFSQEDDIIFFNELQKISHQNKLLQVVYTVTSKSLRKWVGEKGRTSKKILNKYIHNTNSAQFFIAGPTEMVDAIQELLTGMGISQESIYVEYYPGYGKRD